RAHLFRTLAAGAAVPEDHPSRPPGVDLLRGEAFVLAVVPLTQVRLEHGLIPEAGEPPRVDRTLQRPCEDQRERFLREDGTKAPRDRAPVLGQRNIRRARVLAAETPRGLPVADHVDRLLALCHRLAPANPGASSARGRPAPASEIRGGISAGPLGALAVARPAPLPDLGHVLAVPGDVLLVLDQLVANGLLGVRGARAQLGDAIDDVLEQMETIHVVEHD